MMYSYRIWKLVIFSNISLELQEITCVQNDDIVYHLAYNSNEMQAISQEAITRTYDGGNLSVTLELERRIILLFGKATAHAISLIIISDIIADIIVHEWRYPVLHASAVCKNNEAIAFVGASHSGKSTLASFFALNGYKILTDDIFPVIEKGRVSYTVSLQSGIKLRQESVKEINRIAGKDIYSEKVKCHFFDNLSMDIVPISAIYILSEANNVIINEIQGMQKVLFFIRNLHRSVNYSILNDITQKPLSNIRMFSLAYPRAYSMCEEIVNRISDG